MNRQDWEPGEWNPPPGERGYEPIHPGTNWRKRIERALGPVVGIVLALAKWSFILVKFSSIFIAVAAYALLGGWTFAIGFVFMLFAHEMGHYIEAKREGLDPKLPVFIPFLLAYVRYTRGHPWQTVRVAIAGPIFGGLASLVVYFVANARNSDALHYVAYVGFFLNLINLIPVSLLDGGAVLSSARWLRMGGGRQKALAAYALYFATAAMLILGMVYTYRTQNRL